MDNEAVGIILLMALSWAGGITMGIVKTKPLNLKKSFRAIMCLGYVGLFNMGSKLLFALSFIGGK